MQEIRLEATYKTNVKQAAKQDEQAIRDVGNAFTETAAKGEDYERATQSLKGSMSSTASESRSFKDTIRSTNNEMKQTPATAAKSSSAFGNLGKSLMRIAKLRFLRGIIRSITQAFSEGLGNIYQYSTAIGNVDASHISGTMNEIASTFLYVKNSIGSVVAPLLTSLLPAIQTVAGWFVVAANAVAQFFAALGGQSTYTRAKKQATTWKNVGAAVGGAAAAAQEYKNTILGFDEIHALDSPPSSGGGGGGGGGASPDFSDMFEEVPLATDGILGAFNKLAQTLRPITQAIGRFIAHDIVENGINVVNGGITALMGVFEKDKEKFASGLSEIQDVVANTKWLQTIVNAVDGVIFYIAKIPASLKLKFLEFAEWLFSSDFMVKLGSWLLGIDLQPYVNQFKGAVDAQREVVDSYDEMSKAFEDWYSGAIDTKEFLNRIHEIKESVKGVGDETNTSANKVSTFKERTLGAFGETESSAKNTSDRVLDLKGKVDNLGRTNLNLSRIDKPLGVLKSDADKAGGSISGVKNNTNSLNNLNPTFSGTRNGLGNLGKDADSASGKVWGVGNAVKGINGMRASVTITATTVASAALDVANKIKKSLGFAEGGFIPGFANGGLIPSYASGGINSASLFMAHENGAPEMVGRIGNHTAVANTSQMVDAMAQGVYRAMSEVMDGNNGNVEVNVTLDGQRLARAVDNANRVRNRRFNVQA